MAKTFTRLTDGSSAVTGTTYVTASISPTAGATVLALFMARSADLASVAAETPTIAGVMGTWADAGGGIRLFDNVNRMFARVFKGTGAVTPGTVTFGTVSGRSLDRGVWYIIEITATGAITIVQASAPTTGNSTTAAGVLAAFADIANATVVLGGTDTNTSDMSAEAGWTALDALGAVDRFGAYIDANDTSPTFTLNPAREWVIFGFEVNEAAGGGGTPVYLDLPEALVMQIAIGNGIDLIEEGEAEPTLVIDQGESENTYVGGTVQLSVTTENVASPDLSWSSDDELIATVDGDGLVSGVGVGSCTITVDEATETLTDSILVTVIELPDGRKVATVGIINDVIGIT